jgi:hypothetical protein
VATTRKKIFDSAESEEKSVGSQFLIVCASPNKKPFLGSQIFIIRLSWPDFKPGIMKRTIQLCSIGSGSQIKIYKRKLKPLLNIRSGILKAEIGMRDGWGQQFAFSVSRIINDNPSNGIGKHLFIHTVRMGMIAEYTNDESIFTRDDKIIEIKMPKVARSYSEFVHLSNSANNSAECAIC